MTIKWWMITWFGLTVSLANARPSAKAATCGYESCPTEKPGFINVHLVPHTHDDAGWLKTVDQYYYGARNDIQKAGVQYIIDSVIDELKDHPDRRFIYVEMAFFYRWWVEQTDEMKETVRQLVNEGRLEFINGGWCMNDEATTHYVDIIDQMSLGLNLLKDNFGECGRPRISWQIDPFGHSREQANLFAQMGYDGLFFGRLDHEDKTQRMASKTMELVWSGSNTLGAAGSLFTAVNYNLYQPPNGFCFDIVCSDEPIIDNRQSRDYNVEKKVTDFLGWCERQRNAYATDSIMLTMGSDFTYQDANVWYTNMDKLIKYANDRQVNGSRYNLFYSTPSCYVKALNDKQKTWPTKTDDFFPYGSDAHSYWTGYFTSRPAIKDMVRQASNQLQACKQMDARLKMESGENAGDVDLMKDAMGIMQHHDAVTGTEKQHVADDYAMLLHKGKEECFKTQTSYLKHALAKGSEALPEVTYCQLNISQCDATEKSATFVVNIYNPLSRSVNKYVRIPVQPGKAYQVLDPDGNIVASQIVPIAESVKQLPGRESSATVELVFQAKALPPLGSHSYYVNQQVGKEKLFAKRAKTLHDGSPRSDIIVQNDKIVLTVDGVTGLLKSIEVDGQSRPVTQEFLWYAGKQGSNSNANERASGAYIFRPDGEAAAKIPSNGIITTVYKGDLVQEIHQSYNSWVSQVIRLYKGEEHVEFDWVVGPIPVGDGVGKEIVSRVVTDIQSSRTFYTDANGRQTIRRVLNARESYQYTVTEPVAGNYYPINSHMYIKDTAGNQASMLVDRSQGGSSLRDGELELMVHRRLLYDDAFGVDEQLNETAYGDGLIVRGTHYFILSNKDTSAKKVRTLAHEVYKRPLVSFISTDMTFEQWSSSFNTKQQSIARILPLNVNLLTLEAVNNGQYLVRLEHVFDTREDAALSTPATVLLNDLFPGFDITVVEETMLGANQLKTDSKRLTWNSMQTKQSEQAPLHNTKSIVSVTLQPMEIRTFLVTLTPLK